MLMTKDYDPVSKLSSLVFSLNVPPAIYCEPGATWFFTDAPETVMQIKEMATRCGLTNVLTLVDHKYKSKGYFSVVVRKSTKHLIGCGCKWLVVSEPNYGKYQKSIIFEFADDGHAFLVFNDEVSATSLYSELEARFRKYSNISVVLNRNSFDTWRVTFDLSL